MSDHRIMIGRSLCHNFAHHCIQMQYRVGGVHPTGLTVARGVGRCPQARIRRERKIKERGSPKFKAQKWARKCQREEFRSWAGKLKREQQKKALARLEPQGWTSQNNFHRFLIHSTTQVTEMYSPSSVYICFHSSMRRGRGEGVRLQLQRDKFFRYHRLFYYLIVSGKYALHVQRIQTILAEKEHLELKNRTVCVWKFLTWLALLPDGTGSKLLIS